MAYFTLSKKVILKQHDNAKALCDILSYSSKTNPDVTPIMEENTSCMFSVHLPNELKNIKDKSRILFLAQGWQNELISSLLEQGIRWFVVDNVVDLETLETYLEKNTNKNLKINLLLRLKLKEYSIRTEKHYVFGIGSDTIKEKISQLRENKYVEKLGIHFHRKSQNMSEWNLQYELQQTFNDDFWQMIDIVNIGGGIPSIYANTNVNVFDSIFDKIRSLKQWFNEQDVLMMMEPGRFISGPAGKLHTTIVSIHEETIIVDASVYNGDLDALVVPVKLLIEDEVSREEKTQDHKMYVVKGMTPCSMDIFRYRVYLTKKNIGNEITFLNAGAYNFASDFCDQVKLETKVVD